MPENLRVESRRAFANYPQAVVGGCEDLSVEVCGDEALTDVLNVVGPCEGRLLMLAVEAVHLSGQQILQWWVGCYYNSNRRMEKEIIRGYNVQSSRATTTLRELETNTSRVKDNDWKQRTRHKNSCTVFHKRMQSGFSKTTHSNLEALPVNDLKEQLSMRQKYLQELIQKIVVDEEQHRKEMDKMEREYQSQIQQLHDMLKEAVGKNRILSGRIQQFPERSPRISSESLLLGDFK